MDELEQIVKEKLQRVSSISLHLIKLRKWAELESKVWRDFAEAQIYDIFWSLCHKMRKIIGCVQTLSVYSTLW